MTDNIDLSAYGSPLNPTNIQAAIGLRIPRGQKFVRGPIPWSWLTATAQLSPSSASVGLVLWLLRGCTNSPVVKFSYNRAKELGLKRQSVYRAFDLMEAAGLVSVVRNPGKSPVVTILTPDPAADLPKGQKFVRGPIPWNWLEAAAQQSPSSVGVGLVLWFLRGCKNSSVVKFSYKRAAELGVKRKSVYSALKFMEAAGLVSVKRSPGNCPVVTILAPEHTAAPA